MLEKFANVYDTLSDWMPNVIAMIVAILLFVLGFAFGFGLILGVYCFIGWILMFVWGAIASVCGLPTFGYWVYVGAVAVLTFIRGGISVKTKVRAS